MSEWLMDLGTRELIHLGHHPLAMAISFIERTSDLACLKMDRQPVGEEPGFPLAVSQSNLPTQQREPLAPSPG